MEQTLAVAVALVWCAQSGVAQDHGFKKPYFGATKAGTFARQKATDEKGGVTEYTYSRLEDVAGERVIELKYEVVSGQFKGTKSITGCDTVASVSSKYSEIVLVVPEMVPTRARGSADLTSEIRASCKAAGHPSVAECSFATPAAPSRRERASPRKSLVS